MPSEVHQPGTNLEGWSPNVSSCPDSPTWNLPGGNTLYEPSMVICAGIGICVGLYGFLCISKLLYSPGFDGSKDVYEMYSLTFLTFACMNTTGAIYWCGFDNSDVSKYSKAQIDAIILDGSFSSITSLNFFLCALSDYSVLKINKHRWQLALLLITYWTIYQAYTYSIYNGKQIIWTLLYLDLTKFGSLSFFALTLLRMVFTGNWHGSMELFESILIGITGIEMLANRGIQLFFCNWMNGYFDGMNIWYLQSDASLILLFVFFLKSHSSKRKQLETNKLNP